MLRKVITSYLVLVFSLFCLQAGADSHAADTELLFPSEDSSVTVDSLRLIGRLPGPGQDIIIRLTNGQGTTETPQKPAERIFSQILSLAPGTNTVSLLVEGSEAATVEITRVNAINAADPGDGPTPFYLHSKNELTGQCDLCHLSQAKERSKYKFVAQQLTCITNECHPKFDQARFLHGPFADGSCVECHTPHGTTNKNFLLTTGASLCFTCHTEAEGMMSQGKTVHFPVLKGDCLACHEVHKSNLEYHLQRGSIIALCGACHPRAITTHEFMHEPVESGDCNACHAAHVSENRKLLYEDGAQLCLNCHEVREEEFKRKYVHEPVKKDCNLCHDPHGSSSAFHLRNKMDKDGHYIKEKKPIQASCLICHTKLDPEVAQQILESKVTHEPVVKGNCTVCHTPHSTNYKKQLNAPLSEICYTCHKKIKELITTSIHKHGPVRTDDCAQCHISHGSDHKYLLRAKFSTKYSENFKVENYQLCFNCHNAKVVLDKMTEDTGFRNGTQNLHYLHVNRKKKGRNCRTCHDIHASDQEKHIRRKIPYKRKFSIDLEFTKTATGGGCVVGCHKPKKYDRQKPERY